ncbi:MAG TPA: hypothetical protein VM223_08875 [Planctomycetota bacterium]|nr:hypothetical protein [Planctomycetota bacterium]
MARKLLGEILRDHGKVTDEQIREALNRQLASDDALGHILFDMGLVTESDVWAAWSEQLAAEVVDLSQISVSPDLLKKLPRAIAEKYNVFPVKAEAGAVSLAMSDPLDDSALDELAGLFLMEIRPVVSSALGIAQAIEKHYAMMR